MSYEQLNLFLKLVSTDKELQTMLREAGPAEAVTLAARGGFDITVGDLTRYKARATTWQLSDDELAVVAEWQPDDQPYWWQHIWGC